MAATRVTKVRIASRRGGNGRPSSGDAAFSDGKDYGFITDWQQAEDGTWSRDAGFVFFAVRKRVASVERVMFHSPARSAALEAFIDA